MAYTTLAEVRALDVLTGNEAVYPDAALTEGIAQAKRVIDDYCGTTFEYEAVTATVEGNGTSTVLARHDDGYPVLFVQSVTSATVDGVAVADVSGWGAYPDGRVVRDSGVFAKPTVGPNVVLVLSAGITSSPPTDIAWAARTLARQYVLEQYSKVPSRALSMTSDSGSYEIRAQAGGVGRPTNLPDVNAVLSRHRHRPVVF